MTPRQLRYFLQISRDENITSAARTLGIAQPALSQHISAMEEELGVTLLHRHARGVSPTAEGRRLMVRAASILRQLDEIKDDVAFPEVSIKGPVRLSMPRSIAGIVAPHLFGAVQARYPDVRLLLSAGTSTELLGRVKRREVMLALVPNAYESAGLSSTAVFEERFKLFGTDAVLPTAAREAKFESLKDCVLVLPDRDHDLRKMVERVALAKATPLRIGYEINDGEIIRALTSASLAATIMPSNAFLLSPGAERVKGIDLVDPVISRTQSLVWSLDPGLTPAGVAVKDVLVELIHELLESGKLHGRVC